MMTVDVMRLNEAARIDVTRAEAKADKVMAERRMEAELLAAASMAVEGPRRWYALRTQGIGEIELCGRLVDSSVDAVVPVKTVHVARRSGARGGRVIHKPVLRGMVFVRMVWSERAFAGLLRVRGVAAMIGADERPHPIGDREMNGFMDLAQAGAFDERNMPTGLKVGAAVRIAVGPYADFDGVLEGYARGRTARVRTWLFGRDVLVDVRLAHLKGWE